MRSGEDALIIALGSRVHPSLEAAEEIARETGKSVAVFNARFIKPLPVEQLLDLGSRHNRIVVVEENVLAGGFGSAVLELFVVENILKGQRIKLMGIPDVFVEHGPQRLLRKQLGLDKTGIKKTLAEILA